MATCKSIKVSDQSDGRNGRAPPAGRLEREQIKLEQARKLVHQQA